MCPWNRKARFTREESFHPRDGLVEPDLEELAGLSQEAFNARFKDSPVKRSKRDGLLRNVAVAMGNSGEEKFLPVLRKLAQEESPLVAEHAQWAMEKIGNADRDEN
ncbi:MAG: hypothetical protein D6743_07555 [Calditrichaeota bacterium]|nr:MAG: hypothetical protein D6743_07555 [Calditrichota bacterium]